MNKQRTFGWIQNPSSFKNLKNTVQVFIQGSPNHRYLCRILQEQHIITDPALAASLYAALQRQPPQFSYRELVGTGSSDRKSAKCDALVQASIPDQKGIKGYVDNWSADGFVRWAECLGFIRYDETDDTFGLTDLGLAFGLTSDELPDSKNEPLIEGLLQYPPSYRVLTILNQDCNKVYSKFEIGAQLGFTGELGFTSIPFSLIYRQLQNETDEKEIKTIRSDREGSSDKYARMICGWLSKIGLVYKETREIENKALNKMISLGHCFRISEKGLRAISKIEGRSSHRQVQQYMSWYMLATNANNRFYLRSRRAYLLQFLKQRGKVSLEQIESHMQQKGFHHAKETYIKDIQGLIACGIRIEEGLASFRLRSDVRDFPIPVERALANEELEQYKEKMLLQLPNVRSDFIELLEISRDKSQSMIFESKVMDLLSHAYGLTTLHLGGASKPDGICYHQNGKQSFGIIVDTKAYKEGFSLGASEKDKMVRYITENQTRDANINPTKWWDNFPSEITRFYYLFVSSTFIHQYQQGLEQIKNRTQTSGAALDVEQLLRGAQKAQIGELQTQDLPEYFKNQLLKWSLT